MNLQTIRRLIWQFILIFISSYQYLLDHGVEEERIIRIELDQRRYYQYRNPITLCEYVESVIMEGKDRKFYLLIDEVQLTGKVVDKENGGIEVTIYDMLMKRFLLRMAMW